MPTLPPTRASLLLRLCHPTDADAWAEFLTLYGPAVYGYFRRRGVQEADAVDLAQEVFRAVAVAVGRLAYDPARGRFRAWLFTVVSRQLLAFRRRQRRAPVALDHASLDEQPADDPDAEAVWEATVRQRLFERALELVRGEVSDATYQAFVLTAVDGLSGEDAAGRLGISRAAVYLARGRVLARLRAVVETLDATEGDL